MTRAICLEDDCTFTTVLDTEGRTAFRAARHEKATGHEVIVQAAR